jgi:ABC-type nitrate/sulfonate/bicarbonate transport system substrate-binding protein
MKSQGKAMRWLSAAVLALGAWQAQAADKVIAGSLGGQAPSWPFYIALDKGFLTDAGIDMELNFTSSPTSVMQQLTGGSIVVAVSVGATDPLQAIDKGASLAIVRIIGDSAPYALIAKPSIKTIADLRGKTISIGSDADITNVYFQRMMEANGLHKGDYDTFQAGVAAARYAALQAGVADAALVLPPLNFHADKAGFHTIGLPFDYVKDFPFTCMVVLRPWAVAHEDIVRRIIKATDRSIAWFNDPANRPEAIKLLVADAHATPEDAEASYDFLRRIDYFAPTDKVSRTRLQNLIEVDKGLKYVDGAFTADRVVLPGVTDLAE